MHTQPIAVVAAPDARPAAASTGDALARLLGALDWHGTDLHVGQYCGRWQASTAGHRTASFHVVLRGHCLLQRPGQPDIRLAAGDAVFFANDAPHRLVPVGPVREREPAAPGMRPVWPSQAGGTALACGRFIHRNPLTAWILGTFDVPVLRRAATAVTGAGPVDRVIDLMREEADACARSGHDPTGLVMGRLIDLLLACLLRQAVDAQVARAGTVGPWAIAADPDLSRLLPLLLDDPGSDWTAERMAARVHLSRAAFFRRFRQLTGEAPGRFVSRLRMACATRRLENGDSVEQAAEAAGFQSTSAFHRAFVRHAGDSPGRFRRLHAAGERDDRAEMRDVRSWSQPATRATMADPREPDA